MSRRRAAASSTTIVVSSVLACVLVFSTAAAATPTWLRPGLKIERFSELRTTFAPFGPANTTVTQNRRKPHPVSIIWQPADLGVMTPPSEPWPSGGGIWEIDTPYGRGFKVVCTPEMTTPWGGKTAFLADSEHLVQGPGHIEDWSWRFMLPSAGNPGRFASNWHAGVLWEFHTETMSGMHLAIDGSPGTGPRLRFGVYDRPTEGYKLAYDRKKVKLDHWYTARMRIKWSDGPDGFFQGWLDGELSTTSVGPTLKLGEHPYLQFGFYAHASLRNEVRFADIRKR